MTITHKGLRRLDERLFDACEVEDPSFVIALLDQGANVHAHDDRRHSPLHWASLCGRSGAVHALLARGARINDPNGEGRTALHRASISGRDGTALVLIAAGESVDLLDLSGKRSAELAWNKKTRQAIDFPLHACASRGLPDLCVQMLSRGWAVEAPNGSGKTALQVAIKSGHASTAAVLRSWRAAQEARASIDGILGADASGRRPAP